MNNTTGFSYKKSVWILFENATVLAYMWPALRKGTINFETFNNIILVHNMLDELYNVV